MRLSVAAGLAMTLVAGGVQAQPVDAKIAARVERVLAATPLVDGHNDFAEQIQERFASKLDSVDLRSDTSRLGLMTDIPRLKAGHVGGQFWSVYIPVEVNGPAAVQMTMEQIDIVKGMAARYPDAFEMAYTADDVRRIHKAGRVASLIGMEGGHQINDSLPALRQLYAAGVRYMTLTHVTNVAWADSATDNPKHDGLTPFGKAVVSEMNRLGMLVDLSHVSEKTMKDALAVTKAPVIYSHSSARNLDSHPRNVSDEVLALVAKNRGVVMVNFETFYISQDKYAWMADRVAQSTRFSYPPYGGLYIGQPEKVKAAMDEWDKAHPAPVVTLSMVADHVEHIAKVCGVDCVGLGSDFDGVNEAPVGLDAVDKFPALLAELARRGWSDADLAKVAGGNVLRVLKETEVVAKKLQATTQPSYATLSELDGAAR